jgi:hypothetical protein
MPPPVRPLNRSEDGRSGGGKGTEPPPPSQPPPPASTEGSADLPDCGICFTPIDETTNPRGVINSCNHVFCSMCITAWGRSTNTCPHCKRRFTKITTNGAVQKIRRRNLRPEDYQHDESDDDGEDLDEREELEMVGGRQVAAAGAGGAARGRAPPPAIAVRCRTCGEGLSITDMVTCENRGCDYVAHLRCVGLTEATAPERWYCQQHQRQAGTTRQDSAEGAPSLQRGVSTAPQAPPPLPLPPVATGTLGEGVEYTVTAEDAEKVRQTQALRGLEELRRRREAQTRKSEARKQEQQQQQKQLHAQRGGVRDQQPQNSTEATLEPLEAIEQRVYENELMGLRALRRQSNRQMHDPIGLRKGTWDALGRLVIPRPETKEEVAQLRKREREEDDAADRELQARARLAASRYIENVRALRERHATVAEERRLAREQVALLKLQELIAKRRQEFFAQQQRQPK